VIAPLSKPHQTARDDQTESLVCPACGEEQSHPRFSERHDATFRGRRTTYVMYRCLSCRTEFAEPRMAAPQEWYAEQGEYYGWRWEFDCFLEDLNQLRNDAAPLTLLEIGCGEGLMLQKLQGRAQTWGLEINTEAVRVAESRGLRIMPMTLETFQSRFPELTFDVVAFFQVIEHVENPFLFLHSVKRVLRPGGRMYCSIPHPRRYQLLLQRERWDYPPHHLTRFSKEGIARLLERAGFELTGTQDLPLTTIDLKKIRDYLFESLSIPKCFKSILKNPADTALRAFARCAGLTGRDYYMAVRRSDGHGSNGL